MHVQENPCRRYKNDMESKGQHDCVEQNAHPRSHDVRIGQDPSTSSQWTRLLPVNHGVQVWRRLPVQVLQQ